MINYIINNLDLIEPILLIIVAIYALVTRRWLLFKETVFKLMLDAERSMATKKGKARMEAVFIAVWARTPKWIKRFVSEKTLREKLQEWYNIAKNSLSENSEESETTTT